MKKTFLTLILTVLFVLVPTISNAQTSGECGAEGDNVTWTLDNGTLTISGTGAMKDYYSSSMGYFYDVPWKVDIQNIEKVVISSGVTHIGGAAFDGATFLESVTIPSSVTSIGDSTFQECKGLNNVEIPSSVKTIGNSAFKGCLLLKNLSFSEGLTDIGQYAFFNTGVENVVLPEGLETIGYSAFAQCSALKSVEIPDGITVLETNMFEYCQNLKRVVLPDSITTINYNAFYYCTSLESINMPANLNNIDNYAFAYCAFKTLTIPAGVQMGKGVFDGCASLESVVISEGATAIGETAFRGCSSLKSVTIPSTVKSIGYQAFSGSGIESITIPEGVETIGMEAFQSCDKLTSITIADSVTSIGMEAFYRCSSLESIALPGKLTEIAYYTFAYCDNLKAIYIPKSVTTLADDWGRFTNLTIYYGGSESRWSILTAGLTSISNIPVQYNATGLPTDIVPVPTPKPMYYTIDSVQITDEAGNYLLAPALNQSFIVEAEFTETLSRSGKDYLFTAVYSKSGQLLSIDYIKANFYENTPYSIGFHVPAANVEIGEVKVFVWSSFGLQEPLAQTKSLTF